MNTTATFAPDVTHSVTRLISEADPNVPDAVNRLFSALYSDLYRVARNRVRSSGQALDISATLLLHETYERLVNLDQLKVSDRQQFFRYAATAMRSIIVDMARSRLCERNGAGAQMVPFDTLMESSFSVPLDETVVKIHQALDQLEAVEPRLARVVEMRYFAGLEVQDVAEALGVGVRTVARDWDKARSLMAAMLCE